ncbi:MAG TPA: FtsX-like permease family protein [Vicinamibacterales bacterium]|nr:FtsX-like permease family protein [Vicinamibacterales bacterium]
MTAFALAWRTARRYRARAVLAVVGVAVIGALNFDMLMLSRGLLLSFATMINSTGYDIRVAGASTLPLSRSPLTDATTLMNEVAALPEVDAVALIRTAGAVLAAPGRPPEGAELIGSTDPAGLGIWKQATGGDLTSAPNGATASAVISRPLAVRLGLSAGSTISVRVRIVDSLSAMPPVTLRVAGIAEFPFESQQASIVATTMDGFKAAYGGVLNDEASFMFARSRPPAGAEAAADAINRLRTDIHAFSNEQVIANFGRNAFTYFRQISVVLSATTAAFSMLLVATLLTVSVNQRLGEVAALRALGISRRRIASTLLWEAALLVGIGGVLALPLGELLATVLDKILRRMPGLPSGLHFFIFERNALVLHAAVLAVTAVVAAMYPVWLAVHLPIAQTLRQEVS